MQKLADKITERVKVHTLHAVVQDLFPIPHGLLIWDYPLNITYCHSNYTTPQKTPTVQRFVGKSLVNL